MSDGIEITVRGFKSVVFTVTNQRQVTILAISQVSQLNWLKKKGGELRYRRMIFLLDGQETKITEKKIKITASLLK